MGKPTGFMEIDRQTSREISPEERIKNFNEFQNKIQNSVY